MGVALSPSEAYCYYLLANSYQLMDVHGQKKMMILGVDCRLGSHQELDMPTLPITRD